MEISYVPTDGWRGNPLSTIGGELGESMTYLKMWQGIRENLYLLIKFEWEKASLASRTMQMACKQEEQIARGEA